MENQIYDEKTGLRYELRGDYYLPCLEAPESHYSGVWGERHRRYLREHRHAVFSGLLYSGKLEAYLDDVNRQAEEMFTRLIKEMAEKEGITEGLKAEDQMLWVQKMNTVWETAAEVVNSELIYA